MIVGISGLSGSGKSAAGDVLVKNHGFVAIAFADIMKRICMEVFDFTEEQVWGDGKNIADERYQRKARGYACTEAKFVGKLPPPGECEELDELTAKAKADMYLTPRYALQKLGSWGRECYPMVWAEHTLRVAKDILSEEAVHYSPVKGAFIGKPFLKKGVVITDVRFKNEIAAIKEAGGKVIRIIRLGHMEPKWDHPSEMEQLDVPDEEFDYILHNVGDLYLLGLKVGTMLDVLRGKILPYDAEQADVPPFKRKK